MIHTIGTMKIKIACRGKSCRFDEECGFVFG